MDRQPLIAAATAAFLLVAGCPPPEPYGGAFDEPVAAAVLQPEVGGPFLEPVGLVANHHGGQIVPLALKQGRFLTDDATVSFVRGHQLPTGALRLLTSVAVTARGTDEVTAWAGDERFGVLLRVPWILDCDELQGRPECADPGVPGAPVEQAAFVEIVEQPANATIGQLRVKTGYTATETWTMTYDGDAWSVEGSRSGVQPEQAFTGVPYSSEVHRIGFTIEGTPSRGDQIVVKTRNGLEEIGVGGAPVALSTAPDGVTLAMIVHDRSLDRPVVRWFDTDTQEVVGTVGLAPDAWPTRLAWTEDGALLVADDEHPAVWEVAPLATTAREHPMPWPTLDVTELASDRSRLYVVPREGHELWLVDRETDEILDVNPSVEGAQGMPFLVNVVGVEAMREPYRMPEYTDDQVRRYGRSVAVALSSGSTVFAHEEDGCLVQDGLGPRTAIDTTASLNFDYVGSFQSVVPGAAVLEQDGGSGRHVIVNRCAGIAPTEAWTMIYDQNAQGWRVRGSASGEQEALAVEDERYLSDGGEVSFVVRAGTTPSQDGWTVRFTVDAGVATATGDNDGDQIRDIDLGTAGDPVSFTYRVGLNGPIGDHEGTGWYPVDVRPLVLVPGGSTNEVGRVDPQRPGVDVGWE